MGRNRSKIIEAGIQRTMKNINENDRIEKK